MTIIYLRGAGMRVLITGGEEQGNNSPMRRLLPYAENFMGFLIVLFLTYASQNGMSPHMPDFRLVYIVITGIMHGTGQSALSALLSCALYLACFLNSGRDILSLLNDNGVLLQLSFYVLTGIAAGYAIDLRNKEAENRKASMRSLEQRYAFLLDIYNDTLAVKDELADQIINSRDSLGRIHSIIKETDSLEPELVLQGGIHALEYIMKSDEISIYSIDGLAYHAMLAAKSRNRDFCVPNIIKVKDRPDIKKVLESKDIFINRELSPFLPLITAPIMDRGRVVAVASLHGAEFDSLTLYRCNQFKVAVSIISSALTRAYRYSEAVRNSSVDHVASI
jgi:UDP-glucuronate decarboxylase